MRKGLMIEILFLGVIVGVIGYNRKEHQEKESIENIAEETKEYEIYNTMIFQNGATKEVYCTVKINAEVYVLEEIEEMVRKEYISLNGDVANLIVHFR